MVSRHGFPNSGSSALVLLAVLFFVAGCNNSCFFGVVNPPNNSITVIGGNAPPPACSLSQPMTTVKVAGNITPACVNCASSQQVSHVYLYLSGIEFHPGVVADDNSPEWRELAPELAKRAQLVDLVDDAGSVDLTPRFDVSGHVPAGTYYQLRLHLAQAAPSPGENADSSRENACATHMSSSCLISADGSSHALSSLSGTEYMHVQATYPLDMRAEHLNQIRIQFRAEWSLRKTSTGTVELAPFVQGEVVGNANLPLGALK
jgi:hypothetical protein